MGFLQKLFSKNAAPENPEIPTKPEMPDSSDNQDKENHTEKPAEPIQTDIATLRDDGIRAMRIGELAFAEKCFLAALERQDNDEVKSLLAEAYIHAQAGSKALPLLEELIERHPEELNLLLARARAAQQAEAWDVLEEASKAILQVDASNTTGIFYQALALFQLQQPLPAVAMLTQLLCSQPDLRAALLLRARILFSMQQYNEALTDVEVLLKKEEPEEDVMLLKGDILKARGDADTAIETYRALLELNPFQQEAVLRLGTLLTELHRLDEAIRLYDETIELQPDFAQAYKERGGVRLQLHDEAGAADDLKTALELSPETGRAIDGEFCAVQNEMNARYRSQNPFGF